MNTISVQEIQSDPLGFFQRVEAGDPFLVTRGELPVAEVRPVRPHVRQQRPSGLCAGQFTIPADFDEPLPEEILRDFQGQ